MLEGSAPTLAAGMLSLARVEVENELGSQNTGVRANLAALSEAGQSLHRLIVDHCGNQVLSRTIRSLQDHFVRFRRVSLKLQEKGLTRPSTIRDRGFESENLVFERVGARC